MVKFDNRSVDELAQVVDERICVQNLETLRELRNMVQLQKKDVGTINQSINQCNLMIFRCNSMQFYFSHVELKIDLIMKTIGSFR